MIEAIYAISHNQKRKEKGGHHKGNRETGRCEEEGRGRHFEELDPKKGGYPLQKSHLILGPHPRVASKGKKRNGWRAGGNIIPEVLRN